MLQSMGPKELDRTGLEVLGVESCLFAHWSLPDAIRGNSLHLSLLIHALWKSKPKSGLCLL